MKLGNFELFASKPKLETKELEAYNGFTEDELNILLERAETRIKSNEHLKGKTDTCIHIANLAFPVLVKDKNIDPNNITVYAIGEHSESVEHVYLVITDGSGKRYIFNHPKWNEEFGPRSFHRARLGSKKLQEHVKKMDYYLPLSRKRSNG